MGIEDLTQKAKDFVNTNSDKVQEALKSEQAEGISDKVLGGVADAVNKVTGDKFADQVENVRDSIDKKIGNE
ncbi:MAG: antitoxin [Mycetocola sp.]